MRPFRPLAGLSFLALTGLLSPATGQPGGNIPAGKGQLVGRVTTTDGAAGDGDPSGGRGAPSGSTCRSASAGVGDPAPVQPRLRVETHG